MTRATTIEDPYAYFALSKDGQSVEEVDWNDSRSALQLISIGKSSELLIEFRPKFILDAFSFSYDSLSLMIVSLSD